MNLQNLNHFFPSLLNSSSRHKNETATPRSLRARVLLAFGNNFSYFFFNLQWEEKFYTKYKIIIVRRTCAEI